MPKTCLPLLTPGRIASLLGVPLHRVQYILSTRPRIQPSARGGTLRLFDQAALECIRNELDDIASRHGGKDGAQ